MKRSIAALAWLEGCASCQRLFLFVHLFDPHGPMRPPETHLDAFRTENPEARARHAAFLNREQGIPLAFYRGDPGAMLFIVDRYDAEIRFTDHHLGRLWDYLQQKKLLDDTVIVVAAAPFDLMYRGEVPPPPVVVRFPLMP